MKSLLRKLLGISLWMLLGAVLVLVLAVTWIGSRGADLEPWHRVVLEDEFTAASQFRDFGDYLELEDRLFRELEDHKRRWRAERPGDDVRRYLAGSMADPALWERNWNRSFSLPKEDPRCAVLLLHGLSDSPYSLRGIGLQLQRAGAWVLGLRLPGHGTLPSALTRTSWEDMAAAVALAMRHLRNEVPERPIHVVGYSNGGALAVEYALRSLLDESLPEASSLVLISPMIGVSPAAGLAVWQERLGRWLGVESLSWNHIGPEYDPFKYISFAIHAGQQSHRLTAEIHTRIDELRTTAEWKNMPSVLAFQSAADATVSSPAVISSLMEKLAPRGHRLVLFDVNRQTETHRLLQRDPVETLGELLRAGERPYSLAVLRNQSPDSPEVVAHRVAQGSTERQVESLGLAWPKGVYSLSHVALPFAQDDPLYGRRPATPREKGPRHIHLGELALRGERGVLLISPAEMLRQRWNPFHSFLMSELRSFIDLER
jgi:alpha-beta hydrolase superfamily lysophospholipase